MEQTGGKQEGACGSETTPDVSNCFGDPELLHLIQDTLLRALQSQQSQHQDRIEKQHLQHEDRITRVIDEAVARSVGQLAERMRPDGSHSLWPERGQAVPLAVGKELSKQSASYGGAVRGTQNVKPSHKASLHNAKSLTPADISKPKKSATAGELDLQGEAVEIVDRLAGTNLGADREMKKVIKAINAHSNKKVLDFEEFDTAGMSWLRRLCGNIIHHSVFEVFITMMILANSCLVGLTMDWMAENGRSAPIPTYILILDLWFTVVFTVELILRVIAMGKRFLKVNRKWAIMDTVIVCSALIEQSFLLSGGSQEGNVNVFGALRMMRLVRVARSVRLLQFSRDLRALIMGVIHCMKPLFWALLFLLMVTFTFAVVIIEFAVDKFAYEGGLDQAEAESMAPSPCSQLAANTAGDRLLLESGVDVAAHIGSQRELQVHFGNLPRAMFSLLKAVSGGQSWGEIAEPLKHISWSLLNFFVLYVGVVILAVLNIVTSIFIENARKNADRDKDNLIFEEIQDRNWRISTLTSVFTKADVDLSGFMSRDEFKAHFADPVVQAFCRALGVNLDSFDLELLFEMLEPDRTDGLDVDSFVTGFIHLRGLASVLDITQMRHENRQISARMEALGEAFAAHQHATKAMLHSRAVAHTPYNASPNGTSGGRPVTRSFDL